MKLGRIFRRQRLAFENPYRRKIANGAPGWQGAAWLFERVYPSQFVKPEIQMNLHASSVTNNQTLVITADTAKLLKSRSDPLDAEVEKLVLAGAS